jgi:PAS domain S-box-containing protein
LYNQAPVGYVTLNQNSIIVQANHTFTGMVNKELTQVINSSFADFLDPDDRTLYLSRYNAFFKHPDGKNMELRMAKNGGGWFYTQITGNLITEPTSDTANDHQQPKLFLIVNDITSRKMVEKSMAESEYNYRTLADSGQALIWATDTRLNCSYFNKVWLDFTGHSLSSALQGNCFSGLHPDDVNRFRKTYKNAFEKHENVSLVFRLRRKDGVYRWLQNDGCPNYNLNGAFVGYINYCLDITDRKEAGEALRKSEEELRELNSQKDKFFSIIAHDLRSPFNGFLGLTEIMAQELNSFTLLELQEISMKMNKSAKNLFELLNNLLEWARMQQGTTRYEPASLALLPLATATLNPLTDIAHKKGIEMRIHIPEEMQLFADENMLSSILRNLASNAVKFTNAGGRVSIWARHTEGGAIEIVVKDSGIGMNAEMVSKLFKLDGNISRKGTAGEPSTGLGLLLCKDFIGKHGGEIWAESEEGIGSTFYFTLPSHAGPSV